MIVKSSLHKEKFAEEKTPSIEKPFNKWLKNLDRTSKSIFFNALYENPFIFSPKQDIENRRKSLNNWRYTQNIPHTAKSLIIGIILYVDESVDIYQIFPELKGYFREKEFKSIVHATSVLYKFQKRFPNA